MSEPSVPVPIQRVIDAINTGDTDAFVEGFTDDGYVDDWGRVLRGAEGVRSWAQTDAIGAGAVMTVLQSSTDGDVTQLRFTWSSRVFNGQSSAFVTVDGDRVAAFRIPPHA